jgi:O-antigen ligase
MSTLLAVLLWHLRDHWAAKLGRHGRFIVYAGLTLTIANVLLIMTGRTGYLVMLVCLGLSFLMIATPRWRVVAVLTPIVMMVLAFQLSPRVHDRVMQIQVDLEMYQQGNFNTSSGQRLDYWRTAVEGGLEHPWIGHGVGSFSRTYTEHGGFEKRILRDPHQQYLFWWAEGGLVAVALLVGFLLSLVRSALKLPVPQGRALLCTVALAATMALSTCPFFGAGMGEFLLLMMAALLATQDRQESPTSISERHS